MIDLEWRMKMGKSYQFFCKICDLNMILYEGVTKKREESPINYFCFNCNNVSYHNTCIDCGDKLIYAVKVPKNQRKLQSSADSPLEIKLVCPKCKSSETILTKIGEWVT